MADQTSSREKILPCLQCSPILAKAWSVMSRSDEIVGEASNISLDNKFSSSILDKAWYVITPKYGDMEDLLEKKVICIDIKASNISLDNKFGDGKYLTMLQKYGTKKDVENDDWDGKMTSQVQDESIGCNLNKYVELDELFNLEEHKKAEQRVSSSSSILDIALYIITQEYEDMEDLLMLKKYGTKKYGKKTSQLQDKFTDCNLNKYEEPFSQDKRKETVQRFISCLIATVVFFWIIFDTCTHSSIIQLQPLHNQHSPIFKWFFLLELIYIVVLVSLVAVSIVVSAPFSRMHSAMLVFWAILMLIKSAQSITEVYVPILGILFTGCYMFVEKQPELPN